MASRSAESDELIEERIASLRAELRTYGREAIDLVQAVYGRASPGGKFDLKNSPFQMIHLLRQEVTELLQQADEQAAFLSQHRADIDHCRELTETLSRVANVVEHINAFESHFAALKLSSCCQELSFIEAEIARLPGPSSPLGAGKVCVCLRREKKMLRSRLVAKLRRLLSEAFAFDYGSVLVLKQLSGYLRCEDRVVDGVISLKDIWQAVLACQCTDLVLDAHLKDIWHFALFPLWKEKKNQTPNVSASPERAEFVLGSVARGNSDWSHLEHETRVTAQGLWAMGGFKVPLPSLMEHLGQLLGFMFSEVFCGDMAISALVGQKLIEEPFKLTQQLLDAISDHIPKSESDLQTFKRTMDEPAKALEWKLEHFFQISKQRVNPELLSSHLSNLPSVFSSFRRKEILKHARDLVLLDYHNTMIASGDAQEDVLSSAGDIGDPRALLDQSGSFAMQRLKFDSCQVSLASCRLLKFVHEVMTQATHASTDVANIFFHSARDALEIFAAIVPVKFAEVIDSIPRMGAVFHNDCLYIAHNAILLTHKYRQEMSAARSNGFAGASTADDGLQGSISFIDFIPRLRKLGEQCMQNHLLQQLSLIQEMVERIKITPDREQQTEAPSTSESLIKGGLQIAGKLRSKFLKVSANIDVDENTLSGINLQKLSQEDDANDDARAHVLVGHLESLSGQWLGVLQEGAYARFMGLLIDHMLKLVMAPVLQADCITETACGEIARVFKTISRTRLLLPSEDAAANISIKTVCPSWRKFAALSDLFEFNLNDIADGLSKKKFTDFTTAEMTSLIKALFEDSPRRQSMLQSIAEMNS